MNLLFLLIFLASSIVIDAQDGSGSGQETSTVTFGGKVHLPNETFIDDLNDRSSAAYMSFQQEFEDALTNEIIEELKKDNAVYDDVSVAVTNLTSGSINVAFLITVQGTTLNVFDIQAIAQATTSDNAIGSFTADEIRDLNECAETTVTCAEFAECVNTIGSFRCDCLPEFFDESGNGTICVTPATVLCEPNKIEISIPKAYLDNLKIDLPDLRLIDESCNGTQNTTAGTYVFTTTSDITSCGTTVSDNGTHVTYSNVLSDSAKANAVIETGSRISIPFSCSYPNNVTASIDPFQGQISSINVTGPEGSGEFNVVLNLYKTEAFSELETETTFQTTESLYIQAEIEADVSNLTVVLERCWATPSDALNDSISHDIIQNSCPVPDAVEGTVNIIANGESGKSRFQVQVFRFVNGDQTYIHCGVRLCSTANGQSCRPTCSTRKRREVDVPSIATLSRVRRNVEEETEKTLGPFYREKTEQTIDVKTFWIVVSCLAFLVVVLAIVITWLCAQKQQLAQAALVGVKLKNLSYNNDSYF